MDKLKALLVALPALFILALKSGLAIGATGTAIEGFGDFLTAKFSNAKIKRFGAFLTGLGRKLEAIGTDIPKLVEDARKWYAVIAKMLGLAVVFALVMSTLQACTPTQREAEAAKAEACLSRPEVMACDIDAGFDCAALHCTTAERVQKTLECLKPCLDMGASGSGGMGGSAGAP